MDDDLLNDAFGAVVAMAEAQATYNRQLQAAIDGRERSWDYSGRAADAVTTAKAAARTALNAYIDDRVAKAIAEHEAKMPHHYSDGKKMVT